MDDVAQEVFLRVYRHKQTYEPKAKVSTWIFKVTVNACLNEIRRLGAEKNRRVSGLHRRLRRRRRVRATPTPARCSPIARAARPLEGAEDGEVAARVRAAIDELPETAAPGGRALALPRPVLRGRRRLHGHQRPAVKSLLTRARENLSKALASYVHAADGPGAVTERLSGLRANPVDDAGPVAGSRSGSDRHEA